jgi:hypothetical protein
MNGSSVVPKLTICYLRPTLRIDFSHDSRAGGLLGHRGQVGCHCRGVGRPGAVPPDLARPQALAYRAASQGLEGLRWRSEFWSSMISTRCES